MKGNLFSGFAHLVEGFKIIFQPGFRLFLLVPLSVNMVLFALLISWASSLVDGWMASLLAWVPEWLAFIEWLIWGLYFLIILMTIFYGFIAAANFIAAPFYGYLSELVEKKLRGHGNEEAFSWKELFALIPRTLKREIQKIMYYLPRVILLLIVGLIPGLNLFAGIAWLVFSCWMMAIQYVDYPADNNKLSFPDMKCYLQQNRLTSFGFGSLTFGLTLLPIINFFAMPAAVAGATVFWVREHQSVSGINLDFEVEAQKKLS